MTIYIFELAMVILLGMFMHAKKISKKTFIVYSFAIMALILGLRGNQVGEDTAHFISIFEKSKDITWKTVLTSGTEVVYETVWGVNLSVEVGYMILNKLIGVFTNNGQWLIFIVACLTCYLMAKFVYDNTTHVFFATYIYLCESLYMQSFNLMRQMFALAIAAQAYTELRKSNARGGYWKAVAYILLACLFHKSAIVLLALIPLWMVKRNQQALKYVIFGSVAFPFLLTLLYQLISKLIPRYAGYFISNYWEANLGGISILWIIEIILCLFIYFRKMQKNDKETFIAVSCTIIYIALEIVGLRITVFTRITLYFRMFLLFLFPLFSMYIRPKSRLCYKVGVMTLLGVLFMSYANSPARTYQFFWN